MFSILMCTYNGEKFLSEQLDSFEKQSISDWRLYVSDDGSKDATLSILEEYKKKWGEDRLTIFNGPEKGCAQNFFSLTKRKEVVADYYAWSDQDDIWLPDKLQRSLAWLKTQENTKALLYCGRTMIANEQCKPLYPSTLFTKKLGFSNALVQSLAGANTMVFNEVARKLIIMDNSIELEKNTPFANDWWAYQVISAVEGNIFYDSTPMLLYRQHGNNLIGSNKSFLAKMIRLKKILSGSFKGWNEINTYFLKKFKFNFSKDNQRILEEFIKLRQLKNPVSKLLLLKKSGIYRQTILGQLGLYVATLINKI